MQRRTTRSITKQFIKPYNLSLNVQPSIFVDLEESPDSEPGLPEKNTPSPLPPSSPQEFDFVHVEPFDFIFTDFGPKPMHEDLPVPKYDHVEYDPELFNPQQFDCGSPNDNSPTQEPCDEHIP